MIRVKKTGFIRHESWLNLILDLFDTRLAFLFVEARLPAGAAIRFYFMNGAGGQSVIPIQESAGAINMADETVDIETPAGIGISFFPIFRGNAQKSGHACYVIGGGESLVHSATRAATAARYGLRRWGQW